MSILRKAVLGLALTASISGAAFANDPILNFGGQPAKITFDSTTGKLSALTTVSVSFIAGTSGVPPLSKSATLYFEAEVDGAAIPLGGTGGVANFKNGQFSFTSLDPLDLNSNILSGTFGYGLFTATPVFAGNQAISLLSNDISYDGTGYAEGLFNAAYYGSNVFPLQGSMGLTMTAANPAVGVSGGKITSFEAQVSGNFDAIKAVPEPGEWAAMGILATGLTGLMVRSRRRRA